jgi:hypothetical protein
VATRIPPVVFYKFRMIGIENRQWAELQSPHWLLQDWDLTSRPQASFSLVMLQGRPLRKDIGYKLVSLLLYAFVCFKRIWREIIAAEMTMGERLTVR